MASAILILALLLIGCTDDSTAPEEITLLFEDNFDGPEGQLPDQAKWRFDIGTDWGNDQLEYDTGRPENASLDGNGNLRITARREDYEGSNYTSARNTTQGKFAQTRGRFEARIKLPVGQGLWPAFWLLGDNIDQAGWPTCGEIDIMEYRGQQPNIVHGSFHGPGYSGGAAITGHYTLAGNGFNEAFHVFALDWTETEITWLVDGQVYQRRSQQDLPQGRTWVFTHPFFLILNLAVGGTFVGPPNESTQFPQTMLVDWVRVYGTAS